MRANKIKDNTVTRFSSIRDLVLDSFPDNISILLAKTFDLGQAVIVKIAKDNIMLGDFTCIMSSCKSFDNDIVVDLYSKQLGLAIIRQRVEVALYEEKVLTEAIFNSVPGYIYLYNTSGKLIRWNKQHEEMTGYSAEELSHMDYG